MVTAVHRFQALAGIFGAFMAESDAPLADKGAPFHEVGAHLLSRQAAGALGDLDSLFPRPVDERKVTCADGAVDAAWGDEPFVARDIHRGGIGGRCF